MIAVQLVDGRYKCNWCGADLDVPYLTRDTIEIISEHDGEHLRVIVVAGDEHHRCSRPADTE